MLPSFQPILRLLCSLLILSLIPLPLSVSHASKWDELADNPFKPHGLALNLFDSDSAMFPENPNTADDVPVHFVGMLIDTQGSSMPGAVQSWTIRVQEVLAGPGLSGNVLVKWQALGDCWGSYREPLELGDEVEVKGNWGFNNTQDVWLCGENWGSAYFIQLAIRPETITDLTATPGSYPGDIVLQWTAPNYAGEAGKAISYAIKVWSWEITESEWKYATDIEGEPIPAAPGTVETMTVNLQPNHAYYFAIKSYGQTGLASPISNSPLALAFGNLVSDINSDLAYTPEKILNREVTIVAIAARTDDWTLGIGDLVEMIKGISFIAEVIKTTREAVITYINKGGSAALLTLIKAWSMGKAAEIALDLRSQTLWGLHPMEDGDYTLLMLDPNAPLLIRGMPYVIQGIIREKKLTPPLNSFYYLEVSSVDSIREQTPSTSESHFAIPEGYTFRYWVNVKLNEVTPVGENACTIGMVTERYYYNYHHYIRIKLMEGNESALIARVNGSLPAPTLGSLVLACGMKSSAPDVYDGWQLIGKFLDTSTGNGKITLLRGSTSTISSSHEYLESTKMVVKSGSPVDLHVYDEQSHHIGALYDTQGNVTGFENQLPDAEYIPGTDENEEVVLVNNPISSVYSLGVLGRNNGVYTETVQVFDRSGEQTYFFTLPNQTTSKDKIDMLDFDEIPSPPRGLTFQTTETETSLDWDDNSESDLAGYNIYRSTQRYGAYQKLNSQPWTSSTFIDNYLLGWDSNVLVYYYYVTAVDTSYNESGYLTPLPDREIFYLRLPILIR